MQVQSWIDANGNYYEGDQQAPTDQAVPRRTDATCTWVNGAWVRGTPPPNLGGFLQAVTTIAGGTLGLNAILTKYPTMIGALNAHDWPTLQTLILDAHTNGVITPAQYASLQAAVTANNVPMALP